jgi:hypothetical protein
MSDAASMAAVRIDSTGRVQRSAALISALRAAGVVPAVPGLGRLRE